MFRTLRWRLGIDFRLALALDLAFQFAKFQLNFVLNFEVVEFLVKTRSADSVRFHLTFHLFDLFLKIPMLAAVQAPSGGTPGPQAPPPPPQEIWHLVENGQTVGPFAPAQLAQAAATGRLRPDTLVWTAGMAGWAPANSVPRVANLFQPPPPPPER